jgi:hypothetical protein
MTKFSVLVDGRWSSSTSKLGQMVAILFLGLVAAATLHAQISTPVSVSPASGSGSEQAFVATHGPEWRNGRSIGFSLHHERRCSREWQRMVGNECILNYKISSGVIQLAQDVGGAFFSTTATAGTAQTVSNSQCSVLANLIFRNYRRQQCNG